MNRMEAMMQAVLMRLDINPADFIPPEPPEVRAIREAIRAALLSGNKIQAIKLYRECYGASLQEAKDAIDAMQRNLF
jgi:ribosomal protein L7/L12